MSLTSDTCHKQKHTCDRVYKKRHQRLKRTTYPEWIRNVFIYRESNFVIRVGKGKKDELFSKMQPDQFPDVARVDKGNITSCYIIIMI